MSERLPEPDDREPLPVRYEVIVRPLAIEDVAQIRAHIALSNPLNAARYALKLVESFDSLDLFPRGWRRVSTRKFGEVRHRIVRSHRVLFRVDDKPPIVTVLRVMDARQSMRRVAWLLQESDTEGDT